MDRVAYLGEPQYESQRLYFDAEIQGVSTLVVMASNDGSWEIRTMFPLRGRGVMIARNGVKIPVGL